MVGVPRSRGCHLCVKRRVKCDQEKPGCGNCAKYGTPCPGYDKALKFVAGKHQVRPRRRRDYDTPEAELIERTPYDSRLSAIHLVLRERRWPLAGPDGDGLGLGFSDGSSDSGPSSPGLPLSPRLSKSQFVGSMMHNLRDATPENEGIFFQHWLHAEHLGKKDVLDNAISAFALHALGKSNGDEQLVVQSRIIYGNTLTQLQRALNHATEWKAPETLCSTMILCVFELFAGTITSDSWMKHATGVSCLIQQRGPEAYTTSWERSMFLSFRSLIIMNSLFSLQDCFLASRKWQALLLNLSVEDEKDTPEMKYEKVVNLWIAHLARVPSILRHGYKLRDDNMHGMPADIQQVMMFAQQTEKLRGDADAWYKRWVAVVPEPVEVPSREPGSPYPLVLSYQNPWFGSVYVGYWATMLILQECLNQCRWPVDYAEANRRCAHNIYRSLETVGQGIMGPFRVGYAMRIAYGFGDVATQRWIISLLHGYEKTYAATTEKTYPKPEPNQYNYN